MVEWNLWQGKTGRNPERYLPRLRFNHHETYLEWQRREIGTPAVGGERLTAWVKEPLLEKKYKRCCCWVLRHFLTSYVISVASDIEREKSDKFCSEALISASGSFTCRKFYDTGPTALLPFRRKSYSGFLRSEKIIDPGRDRTQPR